MTSTARSKQSVFHHRTKKQKKKGNCKFYGEGVVGLLFGLREKLRSYADRRICKHTRMLEFKRSHAASHPSLAYIVNQPLRSDSQSALADCEEHVMSLPHEEQILLWCASPGAFRCQICCTLSMLTNITNVLKCRQLCCSAPYHFDCLKF